MALATLTQCPVPFARAPSVCLGRRVCETAGRANVNVQHAARDYLPYRCVSDGALQGARGTAPRAAVCCTVLLVLLLHAAAASEWVWHLSCCDALDGVV